MLLLSLLKRLVPSYLEKYEISQEVISLNFKDPKYGKMHFLVLRFQIFSLGVRDIAQLRSCSKDESIEEESESPGCQDDLTHIYISVTFCITE